MTAELNHTNESPWTDTELAEIRLALEAAVARLEAELEMLGTDLAAISSAATVDVLHDELDVASQRAERLNDAVQAENASAILAQTQHVLDRLSAGLYGTCEGCSGQIGRLRLEAFPRATLCMPCAH